MSNDTARTILLKVHKDMTPQPTYFVLIRSRSYLTNDRKGTGSLYCPGELREVSLPPSCIVFCVLINPTQVETQDLRPETQVASVIYGSTHLCLYDRY